LVIGDDFTPFRLFEEHLIARFSNLPISVSGFDLDTDSPTPKLTEVREYLGDPDRIMEEVKDADALVTTFAPITRSVIDAARNLRLIACGRGGPVNVNVLYATQRKIPVVYCPGRNAEAVADYTLGLIICLARNVIKADRYVRSGQWKTTREDTFEKPTGFELQNKTLGIIGFGQVGSRVSQRAKAFGLRTLIYDPYVKGTQEFVDLTTLILESDIITVHIRLSEGSAPLIGAQEFRSMKKGALFINTSRAIAVDENALCEALNSNHLGGAALDVFTQEPIPMSSKLLSLDNVILTPHAAGVSLDIPTTTCAMIANELALFFNRQKPQHVINPEVLADLVSSSSNLATRSEKVVK